MSSGELAEVGYVVRTHGVKGHLRINFQDNVKELSVSEALFLLHKGNKTPFFIKEIEYLQENEAFILFEEIHSKEDAQLFTKKPVYASKGIISPDAENEITFEGFIVKNQYDNEIGTVVATIHVHDYDLLEVAVNKKNILLPFHTDVIISIDEIHKVISLYIADGLLEL